MSQVVEEAHEATGNNLVDQKIVKENESSGGKVMPRDSNDKLIEMVVELDFQNEYMKAQYVNFKKYLSEIELNRRPEVLEHGEPVSEGDVGMLHGEVESLKRQLLEERQARDAAEEALKHLKAAHSEADSKALELTTQLAEAQQRMDQELKERDEKYSELDSKFSRLHKRAKLRIQEVQKEKDDIEVQLREVSEKAERSSSQLSELQQELDRTRQHANEALKAMDVERQQLRTANNKLSDAIDELRHSLASKENALEAAHQSLLEKDQMLEESYGLLKVADEKQQAAISEVSAKHQKEMEDLEAQIADFISERNHAVETISSLQASIAERDTKIAEIDAASSGEAARLKASIETLKGELSNQKNEHDKEKEGFEAMSRSLLSKLEISERNRVHAEVEAAKFKSQLESELTERTQLVNNKDLDLQEANEKIKSIENEFASYKARAHALLQRKDAELASARDNDQIKALEEALKDAERELQLASLEKEKAFEDLKDALSNSEKEISNRDAALSKAEQHMKTLQMKLDSVLSNYQSDKESWDTTQKDIEKTWRTKYEDLERKCAESPDNNLQAEVERLKLHCKTLKEEQMSLQDLADKLMEEKDKEITRLWNENNNLQKLLDSRPPAEDLANQKDFTKQEASNASSVAAEQQILILARQQAQREEELAQTQRHILVLQEEIEELEHENRLHKQQEAMLKEELRNAERAQKRDGVDLTYLKNVVLKLLETGEVERLLPVVAMLLQFSPDEIQKCQQAYSSASLT